MSVADEIRRHVIQEYIAPARVKRQLTVAVRAGTVHKDMGFKNRLPSVCSALGSDRFLQAARVERLSIEGPSSGSNAVFTFRVLR